MALNAAAVQLLVDKGLSAQDIADVMLAAEKKADPTAAERQRRCRENKKAGKSSRRDVTRDPPIEDIHTPSLPDISSDDESQVARDEPDLLEIWVPVAKPLKLACPRSLSPKLRRSYRARLRDTGFPEIKRAIEHIPKSAFLRGEAGNWNGANLDFLLRPDTVRRINEGQFDDRTKSAPNPQPNRGGSTASAAELAMQRLGYA